MLDLMRFITITAVVILAFNPIFMLMYLLILREIISIFSLKIMTPDDLQKLFKIESEALGLSNKHISIRITVPRPFFEAESEKIADNLYLIRCIPNLSGAVIAHELFHIYDGATNRIQESGRMAGWVKYVYWWEPRAIFYELRRQKSCNLILKQAS